jgi:hypothetical protein
MMIIQPFSKDQSVFDTELELVSIHMAMTVIVTLWIVSVSFEINIFYLHIVSMVLLLCAPSDAE